jgi:hypothetical protein
MNTSKLVVPNGFYALLPVMDSLARRLPFLNRIGV